MRPTSCPVKSPAGEACCLHVDHPGDHTRPIVDWTYWRNSTPPSADPQCPAVLPESPSRRCEKYVGHPYQHLTGGDFGMRAWHNESPGERQ